MKEKELMDIFNEVLERLKNAESHCIQEYQVNTEDYSHKDLERDVEEYKSLFQKALNP